MRIEIRRKAFGATEVLRDIYVTLEPGERLAVTGPSGVGKSTLMRIVAGLDRQFEGQVSGVGTTGMVFQEPTLLPWRTAIQNITLATGCQVPDAADLMAEVGLDGKEAAYPHNLSLGQQRRLALARAFAARPDVFLMDEAFASLDEATALRMRELTRALLAARDVTALIVTHDPVEALALGDRVIGIHGTPGQVVFDRRVEDLADAEALRSLLRDLAG